MRRFLPRARRSGHCRGGICVCALSERSCSICCILSMKFCRRAGTPVHFAQFAAHGSCAHFNSRRLNFADLAQPELVPDLGRGFRNDRMGQRGHNPQRLHGSIKDSRQPRFRSLIPPLRPRSMVLLDKVFIHRPDQRPRSFQCPRELKSSNSRPNSRDHCPPSSRSPHRPWLRARVEG